MDLINSIGNPNSVVRLFDDFVSQGSGPWALNWYNWGNNSWQLDNGTVTNPGVIFGTNANTANAALATSFDGSHNPFLLGGGTIALNWVFDLQHLSTVANRYTIWCGLGDTFATNPLVQPNNGVYFSYNDSVNSGNWVLNTANGGVRTATNTSTAATIGFHNLGFIVNAAGSSVTFSIDGVSVGTINTNMPVSPNTMAIFLSMNASAGVLPQAHIDLMYFTQILTTPR